MKERPILFSGPMIRAILAGRKTQTRRVATKLAHHPERERWRFVYATGSKSTISVSNVEELIGFCPYGAPGDMLWVRETFGVRTYPTHNVEYAADLDLSLPHNHGCWSSPIHMPRWASRLTLEIVSVRVERLQGISEEDAIAEGIERIPDGELVCYCGSSIKEHSGYGDGHMPKPMPEHAHEFSKGWDTINGKRAPWASNPWVWVVEFKALEKEKAGRG